MSRCLFSVSSLLNPHECNNVHYPVSIEARKDLVTPKVTARWMVVTQPALLSLAPESRSVTCKHQNTVIAKGYCYRKSSKTSTENRTLCRKFSERKVYSFDIWVHTRNGICSYLDGTPYTKLHRYTPCTPSFNDRLTMFFYATQKIWNLRKTTSRHRYQALYIRIQNMDKRSWTKPMQVLKNKKNP